MEEKKVREFKFTMAGKKKTVSVRIFFEYNQEEEKSVCKLCGEKVSGDHLTNLKKHLRTTHKEEYDAHLKEEESNLKRKRVESASEAAVPSKKLKQENIRSTLLNEITVKINFKTLESACIALVVNGRPLLLMDDPDFHRIIDPILDGFEDNSENQQRKY